MKKINKGLIGILIIIILIIGINTNKVFADTALCHAQLADYNSKKAVGEEFIYDIGTMGVAANTYINEIYYEIHYKKDDLEVVEENGKYAGAYNGWNVEAVNDTNTGLNINIITVHAYTNETDKMYHSIVATEFVKMAYIKFRVKNTKSISTSIEIAKDESYFMEIVEPTMENYMMECNDTVITVVNIYTKDNNMQLSSLKVDNGDLSPRFNSYITSYEVTVDNDVDTIQIDGTCDSDKSKLDGTGLKKLVVGENKFTITVTSERGDTNNYTITVNRREKDEVYLKKLEIKNQKVEMYPQFSSQISNYVAIVPNEVNKLDIEYFTNDDQINKVEIMGNDNLKVGKNYITLTVTNKEKNIETSYEFMIIKEEEKNVKEDIKEEVTETKKTENINIYLIIIVILVLIVIVELVIILLKRKNNNLTN